MRDMAETVGMSKPKRGPGAPPPWMEEEPKEAPVAEKTEGAAMPKPGLGTPTPTAEAPASGIEAVCQKYGADPAEAKAFVREYLMAQFGEGGESSTEAV
jgi:hypothetical protein